MNRRSVVRLLGAALASVALPVAAQAFPTKPVTLIIPFALGGPADVIARTVTEPMQQFLGQRILIESKPGAGGNVAAEFVAKQSRPDGYTVFFGSTTLASSASLMNLNYDARKDLLPVAGIGETPSLVLVGPNSPFKSLAEIVTAAKAKPGSLTFGTSGPGTGSHLTTELLKATAGIDLLHVPYKGSGAVLADLIAGRVDLLIESQSAALGRVKSGQVKVLASTSGTRSAILPDVPTVAESGYPGFAVGTWSGFFVPARTPPEIIAKLEDAALRALRSDPVKERFKEMSMQPIPDSAAAFGKFFESDVETWAKLVREGRLQRIQ